MRVSGSSATEMLTAKSHQAVECDFVLASGRRTRLNPGGTGDPTQAFVGTWMFEPPDVRGTNVATILCDGEGTRPMYAPQSGTLTIAKSSDDEITATTEDGCASTLRWMGTQGSWCRAAHSVSRV